MQVYHTQDIPIHLLKLPYPEVTEQCGEYCASEYFWKHYLAYHYDITERIEDLTYSEMVEFASSWLDILFDVGNRPVSPTALSYLIQLTLDYDIDEQQNDLQFLLDDIISYWKPPVIDLFIILKMIDYLPELEDLTFPPSLHVSPDITNIEKYAEEIAYAPRVYLTPTGKKLINYNRDELVMIDQNLQGYDHRKVANIIRNM